MADENNQNLPEEQFFFGEYEHALDGQCRVAIPAEWRSVGETRLIMLPGREHDLVLMPFAMFRGFLQKARSLSLADPAAQRAFARIGTRARDCRCDKQGRIKLERPLLDAIGVDNQVKLIGAITHIKVCSPASWTAGDAMPDDACLDELQKISAAGSDLGAALRDALREDRS